MWVYAASQMVSVTADPQHMCTHSMLIVRTYNKGCNGLLLLLASPLANDVERVRIP